MVNAKWTNHMTNSLLSHLDTNSGDDGLYMTALQDAAQQAATHVSNQQSLPTPLRPEQVINRLRYLHKCYKVHGIGSLEDLYRQGRTALNADWQEDVLLGRPSLNLRDNVEPVRPNTNGHDKGKRSRGTALSLSESSSAASPTAKKGRKKLGRAEKIKTKGKQQQKQHGRNAASGSSQIGESSTRPDTRPQNSFAGSNNRTSQPPLDINPLDRNVAYLYSIEGFMMRDDYLPNNRLIARLYGRMGTDIAPMIVRLLLSSMCSDISDQIPSTQDHCDFGRSLKSPSFLSLCERAYDVITAREVEAKFHIATLTLGEFLRMMVAIAIKEWIFSENHNPPPFDFANNPVIPLKQPETLNELWPGFQNQVARSNTYKCINAENFFQGIATDLTYRFQNAIQPFLSANSLRLKSGSVKEWFADLTDIFNNALRMGAQAKLLPREYRYEWPTIGEAASRYTMAEYLGFIKDVHGRRVKAVFFPALIHTLRKPVESGQRKGSTEETIFHAMVWTDEQKLNGPGN